MDRLTLKWSDPLGGSSNDYDLYVVDTHRHVDPRFVDEHSRRHTGSLREDRPSTSNVFLVIFK